MGVLGKGSSQTFPRGSERRFFSHDGGSWRRFFARGFGTTVLLPRQRFVAAVLRDGSRAVQRDGLQRRWFSCMVLLRRQWHEERRRCWTASSRRRGVPGEMRPESRALTIDRLWGQPVLNHFPGALCLEPARRTMTRVDVEPAVVVRRRPRSAPAENLTDPPIEDPAAGAGTSGRTPVRRNLLRERRRGPEADSVLASDCCAGRATARRAGACGAFCRESCCCTRWHSWTSRSIEERACRTLVGTCMANPRGSLRGEPSWELRGEPSWELRGEPSWEPAWQTLVGTCVGTLVGTCVANPSWESA